MKLGYRKQFCIIEEVKDRISYLQWLRTKLENNIRKMPEGDIQVCPGSTKNSYRYYIRTSPKEKIGRYLNSSQDKLKAQLAQKRYYEKLLKESGRELAGLLKIEKQLMGDSLIDVYANLNPGIRRLIEPANVDDETYVRLWLSESYEGLSFDQEDKALFISDRGERMRSKSEIMIANMLNKRGVPYKYEKPVMGRGGEMLYPDFTILDVRKRREIYWEHLGKMGDMEYVSKNMKKMDEYKKLGIYLSKNLYITMESLAYPLSTNEISKTIDIILGVCK